jgi:hypothetical protein
MMNKLLITAIVTLACGAAFAQSSQDKGKISSSNANGVQIQGKTEINADQKDVAAIAVGKDNTAKNTAGAIKGGTQIQGNTKINAKQKNAAAIAVGKGNEAANEAGVIGGK